MTKIKDRSEFAELWNGPMTIDEIASHYEVSRCAVQCARRRFDLPSRDDRRGAPGYPVKIRGRTYRNGVAAAKALGITSQAISKALSQGRIDQVGL